MHPCHMLNIVYFMDQMLTSYKMQTGRAMENNELTAHGTEMAFQLLGIFCSSIKPIEF